MKHIDINEYGSPLKTLLVDPTQVINQESKMQSTRLCSDEKATGAAPAFQPR